MQTAHIRYSFCCHGDCGNVCPTDSNFYKTGLNPYASLIISTKFSRLITTLTFQPTEEIVRNVTKTAYTMRISIIALCVKKLITS